MHLKSKSKSKFGMIMNSVSRSAKKWLSHAGQQIASGSVKAKQKAAEKIQNVSPTEEDLEIISHYNQKVKYIPSLIHQAI